MSGNILLRWIFHRVTPATKGTRYGLVGWISGPPLKLRTRALPETCLLSLIEASDHVGTDLVLLYGFGPQGAYNQSETTTGVEAVASVPGRLMHPRQSRRVALTTPRFQLRNNRSDRFLSGQ